MGFRTVRRILGLLIVLSLPPSAQAALDLCNDTETEQAVAIGYKGPQGWASRGWWRITPGQCATVVPGPLLHRFYYLRVETEGWTFHDDKLAFCVADRIFAIDGDTNCARRGYRQEAFARIDTGPDAPGYRHALSTNLTADEDRPAAQDMPPAFQAEAVFQGCQAENPPYHSFCTFIGAGQRYLIYDDGRVPADLWQRLQALPQGRRVAVTGYLEPLFDTTSALLLHSAEVLALNRADRILALLQGDWSSADDPDDRFRMSGAERVNVYAGAETSVEYVAILDHCDEHSGQGPYLFTWDINGGTGLCYRIGRVSQHELLLQYLSQGNTLLYRRE
ncbi:MAG: transporter [Alphaproteobacteria bacterium MedPE-SWcel]|nr:MAG: transporter [Alphaproteobacteria bacterium MedPE-SWcel]